MTTQAVLYAHRLDAMAAFYGGCLGLVPGEVGDDHRELRSGDLTLWLVRGQAPAPRTDADGTVRRRSDVALKLGLEVESIERVATRIAAAGGWVAKRSWSFGGYDRRDAVDPEGNVIQLLEPIAAAAE